MNASQVKEIRQLCLMTFMVLFLVTFAAIGRAEQATGTLHSTNSGYKKTAVGVSNNTQPLGDDAREAPSPSPLATVGTLPNVNTIPSGVRKVSGVSTAQATRTAAETASVHKAARS